MIGFGNNLTLNYNRLLSELMIFLNIEGLRSSLKTI